MLVARSHPLPLTSEESIQLDFILMVLAALFVLIPFCYLSGAPPPSTALVTYTLMIPLAASTCSAPIDPSCGKPLLFVSTRNSGSI